MKKQKSVTGVCCVAGQPSLDGSETTVESSRPTTRSVFKKRQLIHPGKIEDVYINKLTLPSIFTISPVFKSLLGAALAFNERLAFCSNWALAQKFVVQPPVVVRTIDGKLVAFTNIIAIRAAIQRGVQETLPVRLYEEPNAEATPYEREKFKQFIDDLIAEEALDLICTATEVGQTYAVKRLLPKIRQAHPRIDQYTNMRTGADVDRMLRSSETRGRKITSNNKEVISGRTTADRTDHVDQSQTTEDL